MKISSKLKVTIFYLLHNILSYMHTCVLKVFMSKIFSLNLYIAIFFLTFFFFYLMSRQNIFQMKQLSRRGILNSNIFTKLK